MTIFSQDQLTQIVAAMPADLPDQHKNAIVGTTDATGAEVVVGMQRDTANGTWQIQGAYRHTWAGDNEVGARVIYSW